MAKIEPDDSSPPGMEAVRNYLHAGGEKLGMFGAGRPARSGRSGGNRGWSSRRTTADIGQPRDN
jgi:hypothetical protein